MEVQDIMDKQGFLKLFIAQIQNQNPLEPMKNEDFTQQLALFSTVEQLQNLNETVDHLKDLQTSTTNALAVGLIGKTVTSQGDHILLGEKGENADIAFELSDDASEVHITILNANGRVVRNLDLSNLSSGRHSVVWDGLDLSGNEVAPGRYTYRIEAKDKGGNTVSVQTFQKGVVSSLSFENGTTYLNINGEKVPLSEVVDIRNSDA